MSDQHQINTEGVDLVGEFVSRTMREAITAPDYRNAEIAGAVKALEELIAFCEAHLDAAEPYDDVRLLGQTITWARDKIQEVRSSATNGIPDA